MMVLSQEVQDFARAGESGDPAIYDVIVRIAPVGGV